MAVIYVARSAELQDWAADVGLTKYVFKIGVVESAKAAVAALNADAFGGVSDWKLVKEKAVEGATEETARARLSVKEREVDAALYPRLKGATGLFKVKLTNVQARLLVQRMMAGEEELKGKPKVAEIADHLIENAAGEGG